MSKVKLPLSASEDLYWWSIKNMLMCLVYFPGIFGIFQLCMRTFPYDLFAAAIHFLLIYIFYVTGLHDRFLSWIWKRDYFKRYGKYPSL